MKYLCLVYVDEVKLEALSESEADTLVRESLAYDGMLRENGHYVCSEALQPVRSATTLRVRNGRLSATDGPSPKRRSSWVASSSSTPGI